jgi:hypothetical protein
VFTLSSRVYRKELYKILRLQRIQENGNEFTLGTVTTGANVLSRKKTMTVENL